MSDLTGYERFIRGIYAILGTAAGVAIGEPWLVGAVILVVCGRALYDIHKEGLG